MYPGECLENGHGVRRAWPPTVASPSAVAGSLRPPAAALGEPPHEQGSLPSLALKLLLRPDEPAGGKHPKMCRTTRIAARVAVTVVAHYSVI
jgi:hypothetical protein